MVNPFIHFIYYPVPTLTFLSQTFTFVVCGPVNRASTQHPLHLLWHFSTQSSSIRQRGGVCSLAVFTDETGTIPSRDPVQRAHYNFKQKTLGKMDGGVFNTFGPVFAFFSPRSRRGSTARLSTFSSEHVCAVIDLCPFFLSLCLLRIANIRFKHFKKRLHGPLAQAVSQGDGPVTRVKVITLLLAFSFFLLLSLKPFFLQVWWVWWLLSFVRQLLPKFLHLTSISFPVVAVPF